MSQLTLFNKKQSQTQLKQFPAQRSSPQFGNSNQKEQKPGLRPYQKSAIGEVYQLIRQGYTNPLIYAPTGSGKCLGKGTPILMADGSIKPVEEVAVGDKLQGDDDSPRTVLSLSRGKEEMFRVVPRRGEPWECNRSHVLTLVCNDDATRYFRKNQVYDISVEEYLNLPKHIKHVLKLYRTDVDYPEQSVELDPYLFGLWLGDGAKKGVGISKPDTEVENAVRTYAEQNGLKVRVENNSRGSCPTYFVTKNGSSLKTNTFLESLKTLNVIENKHIPREYLVNSREVRLQLLAGLIDTDGYVHNGSAEIVQKNEQLAEDIKQLARSLGFRVISGLKKVDSTLYHRLHLSGDFSLIPTRINRKQWGKRKQRKNHLRTGFSLESLGEGNYYGFTIDGNRRFLLGDFTVTHNTVMASHIVNDAISRSRRVLFLVHRDALVKQTKNTLISYGIPEKLIGFIKAGYPQASEDHQVIVASVQSLARRDYPSNIGLIVVDECHTTSFYNHFANIREAYQHDGQKGAIIIGLSASPWRNKASEGMKHASFDSLVKVASISDLIKDGYLAPPRYFGFGGMMDLSQFEVQNGDYKTSQVQNACMAEGFNERIVQEFGNLCQNRTAIAFCASIEQSRYLAELFNNAGIASEHLEGDTPSEVREQMYQRLSNGGTRVLCSVGTLTEGFDIKSISAILLARPTKSISLYVQICGRGLRPYPGKKDCYILDFACVITGDGKRKGLGFLSDQPEPTLEPLNQKPQKEREPKECPSCGNLVDNFIKICPHCGFEFLGSEDEDDEDEIDDLYEQRFGELFDKETQEKVDYLRKQIRARFTNRQPRDRLWELFYNRYGHYPDNNWFLGALFQGRRNEFTTQKFINYLRETSPIQPPKEDWIRFHLRLEFGDRAVQSFTPTEGMKWHEILQVSPQADWRTIKDSYRKLSRLFHPDIGGDENKMKLINWALDKASQTIVDEEFDF